MTYPKNDSKHLAGRAPGAKVPELAPPRIRTMRWLVLAVVAALIPIVVPETGYADGPRPFGIGCKEGEVARHCKGGPGWFTDNRVKSWDGVPLDVDVTLPKTGSGPWPTLFMLHGWGGAKTFFQANVPVPKEPHVGLSFFAERYNNLNWARKGYAVVNYTARGMVDSCGGLIGSLLEGNGLGWAFTPRCPSNAYSHMSDLRYEIRDTQYLAGLLVDEGIALPEISVTGTSFGGGQTLMLSALNDKQMMADNSLVDWKSPNGSPMRISSAVAFAPWSDLANALMPNGRDIVGEPYNPETMLEPVGVARGSSDPGLFLSGQVAGIFTTHASDYDPSADLDGWFEAQQAGEPYDIDDIGTRELQTFHSAVGVLGATEPAPTFMISGWTDDLFPPSQTLRFYYEALEAFPEVPMRLRYGPVGHSRAQNPIDVITEVTSEAENWIDHFATARAEVPGPEVRSWGTACPDGEPSPGPFDAASYADLAKGEVTFADAEKQFVNADGGRPELGWAIDPWRAVADLGLPWPLLPYWMSGLPIALSETVKPLSQALNWSGNTCQETTTGQDAGVAVYELDPGEYTVLGMPTVSATIATKNGEVPGELASRIWDVDEAAGTQILVMKGIYRLEPNQKGKITFQLNGNNWKLDKGHHLKLEILGRDFDSWRPSNNTKFSFDISDLTLTIPTAEANPA